VRISITRRETVERNWECSRCGAHGHVIFRATGESGWRRVWWSEDDAERAAAEGAKADVHNDAERILGMIRCPTCGRRARGVYAWAVVRNIFPVLSVVFGCAIVCIVLIGSGAPWWVTPPLLLASAFLALLPERQRWREARATTVRDLVRGDPQKVALMRAKKTEAAMPKAIAHALPAPKKEAIVPVTAYAPQPIARPSDDEGPRFLRDR
jgi:hypothetical protein